VAVRARVFLLLTLAGCAAKNELPKPEPRTTVFVSPAGNDAAPGTRAQPLRTIERALANEDAAEIVLASGEYAERDVTISRRIALLGPEDGSATLNGHLVVRANEAVVHHLVVERGVEVALASNIVIDHVVARPGDRDDTFLINGASGTLSNLDVSCGPETCLQVTSSTITLTGLKLTADAVAKRGLRAETSSVTARNLEVSGTGVNQVLASQNARITIVDAKLTGARGSAIAAVKSGGLIVDRAEITDAARYGVLIQDSRAIVRAVKIGPTQNNAIGISGGDVDLIDLTIERCPEGAITINSHLDRAPLVRLIGGTIRHGETSAVLLGQGDLTVQGTHFIGDPAAKNEDRDAIIANSQYANLNIMSANIDAPAGFGVSFTNSASGSVTATITKPRAGGVLLEGLAAVPVVVTKSRIEGCATASGIVAYDSTDVKISQTVIGGCAKAGLLAGQGAVVEVTNTRLTNNGAYGFAAFGGATIDVSASRASGSQWATFATCGDGARIDDAGDNRFQGQTTICP
jgi:hypothetical protein